MSVISKRPGGKKLGSHFCLSSVEKHCHLLVDGDDDEDDDNDGFLMLAMVTVYFNHVFFNI